MRLWRVYLKRWSFSDYLIITAYLEIQIKLNMTISFKKETVVANFLGPSGDTVERIIEIRTNPITGRMSRIAFSRINETEAGTDGLPEPPPGAKDNVNCPFCSPRIESMTPMLDPMLYPKDRMTQGDSILFPNLFPYGSYSAVSLFDNEHFVEIGKAGVTSYANSFINCSRYLKRILNRDPKATYMAITQNHLPSAGGSLVHPHLQVHADRLPSNNHILLTKKSERYYKENNSFLFSDYLMLEKKEKTRYIGKIGKWEWTAAFAPEGFFEIWGILPGITSITAPEKNDWEYLAKGVSNAQKFFRSLYRNGYNLGIISNEDKKSRLELKAAIVARSNYAPWVRNDHTGFEVILGDMATFVAPEETAEKARPFWNEKPAIEKL